MAASETYSDRAVAGKLLPPGGGTRSSSGDTLTPREREIVTRVAYGYRGDDNTDIMQKLELISRAELVRFAITQGWLER